MGENIIIIAIIVLFFIVLRKIILKRRTAKIRKKAVKVSEFAREQPKPKSNSSIAENHDTIEWMKKLSLHPDIEGLIWIANGPMQNYFKEKPKRFSSGVTFEMSTSAEPSAIDGSFPNFV